MKHITEYCGTPTNDIVCTDDEFKLLEKVFKVAGVKLRKTIFGGNETQFQIINPYKVWANLSGEAEYIKKHAEENLNHWD